VAGLVTVTLGPAGLSAREVVAIAREGEPVEIDPGVLANLASARAAIDAMSASGAPVYGVSTGFGSLATTYIAADRRTDLQRSLIRSHAAGYGPLVEAEVVRAMMACRLRTLCSGVTGVRPVTVRAYADLLNAHLVPVVHEYGSLGCSGDLAPLAHVALALMGEGEVLDATGRHRDAAGALAQAGLEPLVLAEKEGLALINGTDGMLAMLLLALADLTTLLRAADVTAALSVQALMGTDRAFAADLQALRPHPGQRASAANLAALMADSPIVASHATDTTQVQDAYSLRCAPQVHGAARDTLEHARAVAEIELVSRIDNPSVLADGRLESNGNFHGAPVGYVLDFLAIAAADVASMAERRTDRLLDPARNHGLPAFLAEQPGVDSGLMIAQYTQAGIVSEMKRLAAPASVDSIPTSAMQEDHVSMGWHAARQLRRSLEGLAGVLGVELLVAGRALALRAPLAPSAPCGAVLEALAAAGLGPGPDRPLSPELAAAAEMVASGRLAALVEPWIGPLA
jgi:histidine ammonia-lyase